MTKKLFTKDIMLMLIAPYNAVESLSKNSHENYFLTATGKSKETSVNSEWASAFVDGFFSAVDSLSRLYLDNLVSKEDYDFITNKMRDDLENFESVKAIESRLTTNKKKQKAFFFKHKGYMRIIYASDADSALVSYRRKYTDDTSSYKLTRFNVFCAS